MLYNQSRLLLKPRFFYNKGSTGEEQVKMVVERKHCDEQLHFSERHQGLLW